MAFKGEEKGKSEHKGIGRKIKGKRSMSHEGNELKGKGKRKRTKTNVDKTRGVSGGGREMARQRGSRSIQKPRQATATDKDTIEFLRFSLSVGDSAREGKSLEIPVSP